MASYYCSVDNQGRIVSHVAIVGPGMMQGGAAGTLTRELTAEQYQLVNNALTNGMNAYWDTATDTPQLAMPWQVEGLPESGAELQPGSLITLTWEHPTYVLLEINGDEAAESSPLEIEVPMSGRLKLEVTEPSVQRIKRTWLIAEH